MKKLFTMLVLTVGLVAPTQAAELRPEAVITGDEIRLGDLFDGLAPEIALTEIAPAPPEGSAVVLHAEWIVRVANAYDVDWEPGYRAPSITVRGATAEERAAAESDVRRALSRVIAAGSTPAERDADAPEAEAGSDMIDVVVPVRRLRSGEVIDAADIAWVSLPSGRVGDGVVTESDDLIGMSPRRTLTADQPVRFSDLRAPIVIERGSAIAMVLETPGLRITARGRALQDGAVGESIRVVNVDSNHAIDAVVTGPNTVAVMSPAALAGF